MRPLLIVLAILVFATPTVAQIGTFNNIGFQYSGPNIRWPYPQFPGDPAEPIYITVLGTWKGARFAAPIPSCSGIQVTSVTVLNGYSYSGDIESGIEVDFGTCLPPQTDSDHSIIRIDWVPVPGLVNCCPYNILPHPAYGQVQLIDCDGTVVPATFTANLFFAVLFYDSDCGRRLAMPVRDPEPADGATNVALDARLRYHTDKDLMEDIPLFPTFKLYFGTDPNPPFVSNLPFSYVPTLSANTKYYWRVEKTTLAGLVPSPVWSFTTTGPTATEASTWGRVKALYR